MIDRIAARLGPATITLHPADATGSLPLRITLSEALPRGVALSHKGHWPKREPARANVNVLNPGHKADMAGNTCVHGVEVTVIPHIPG